MSKPKLLIGLIGYAKSGKDTAAKQLRGWHRVGFADALKAGIDPLLCQYCDPTDPDTKEIIHPLYVEYGRTMRRLFPDFWVDVLHGNMRHYTGERVVIADVRYLNEARWIIQQGGMLIYVKRPDVRPANSEEARSIGEVLRVMANHVYYIVNDGTPKQLGSQVQFCLNIWEKGHRDRKQEQRRQLHTVAQRTSRRSRAK